MRFGSVVAIAATAPLLAGAAQPIRLQPSSPWVVDYALNSCRLVRGFGEGDATTKLSFESAALGEMDMLIIGKPLKSAGDEIPARFLPIGGKALGGHTAQTTDTHVPAILWPTLFLLPDEAVAKVERERDERRKRPGVRPPPLNLADEAMKRSQRAAFASAATELEVEPQTGHRVILETGSLRDAIRTFDKCTRDSMREWGVDPDLEDRIVRPAWAIDPLKWFSSNDYPANLARRGQESVVNVRLLVDASGQVTKCTSVSHFKEPEFSRITCGNIMKRATFEPAELADGTKVPSYYSNRIIFRLAS